MLHYSTQLNIYRRKALLCPKCKNVVLKPGKLDDSLPAMICPECEGALISLLYYRDWAERTAIDYSNTEFTHEIVEDTDSKTSLSCPKCHKIMTKYAISAFSQNRIDLCGSCDEAWLDGGEWQLLKSLEVADRLPKIFTEQWQRRVRSNKLELNKIERLKKMIGEKDAVKAAEIKQWLDDHSHKPAIIQFIASGS